MTHTQKTGLKSIASPQESLFRSSLSVGPLLPWQPHAELRPGNFAATPQSSNKLHSDRIRASSWHNFDMDQIDAQNLSERLQWEQQDYWLHIESSSPLDKYPGS